VEEVERQKNPEKKKRKRSVWVEGRAQQKNSERVEKSGDDGCLLGISPSVEIGKWGGKKSKRNSLSQPLKGTRIPQNLEKRRGDKLDK